MNIVVIKEDGIDYFKSWTEVKKKSPFKKEDFAKVGKDYVMNCTEDTFEISKDIALLERVASEKVFSKDKLDMSNWLQIITLVILLLVYTGLPDALEIANAFQSLTNGVAK